MKNKLIYFFIFLVIIVGIGTIVYFIEKSRKNIFPEGLILNKTISINIKLKPQETVAIFREVDGKEIEMESFFDIGLGCADIMGFTSDLPTIINRIINNIYPTTRFSIYPTDDRLYTEGGYQPRPPELNACLKGKILQFKIQTPYNPEKDVYYLVVIKQSGKVRLKVKLPPIRGISGEIAEEEKVKRTSIKIYNPLLPEIEIFDYHPVFGDFKDEIVRLINYADVFYTLNPKSPANNIEDVKKSDYQELAKNLIESTKKKTVVIELDFKKIQELVLDYFPPPLKIRFQNIILQKDLITDHNLLGYGICALAENTLIYCVSSKSGLTGNREEINKIIRMIEILD